MPACILNVMLKTKHMNISLATLCSHLDIEPEHTELLNERDTSDVWRQFAIWSLVGPDDGVIRFTKPGTPQYNAINRIAQLYINDCKDIDAWEAAMAAADAEAPDDTDAADAEAAYYAAWCAIADAADAADATDAYIDVITNDVAAAKAASYTAAYDNEANAYYERMADKLIELINAAPLKEAP